MPQALLADVNVLVALVWEQHLHHAAAHRWFLGRAAPFATCTVTQLGFVRVSSNVSALPEAIPVSEATAVLRALTVHPDHRFLADDVGFCDDRQVPHDQLAGHRQITDAHLIGLARRHDALLVSFDRGAAALGGETVELLTWS